MIAQVRARAALAALVALAPPAHTEVPCAYHPSTATGLRGSHRWGRQKGRAEQVEPRAERQAAIGAQPAAACLDCRLEVRYLPGEQNPVHLGSCQYFLAIELFSSGTKG